MQVLNKVDNQKQGEHGESKIQKSQIPNIQSYHKHANFKSF